MRENNLCVIWNSNILWAYVSTTMTWSFYNVFANFFAFKVDAHRHNVENEMKLSLISIEIGLADLL